MICTEVGKIDWGLIRVNRRYFSSLLCHYRLLAVRLAGGPKRHKLAKSAILRSQSVSLNVSSLLALKAAIAQGMEDVRAGRVSPVDMASLKALGRAKLQARATN